MGTGTQIKSELMQQHRDAEALLVRLAAAVRGVRRLGPQSDLVAELAAIRRAVQGEVLDHFREEELALFPVLGRHIDSSSGPIAAMMEEHALFRQLELQFEESLAAIEAGLTADWPDKLCDAGEAIGELLPLHIQKEDGVLFPIAEDVLSDAEWIEIGRLWEMARG